ncbi:MAG: Crp/Fnr family transcriptional regulator [Pseudomonadota bacterium]
MDLLDFGLSPLRDHFPPDVYTEALRRARRIRVNDGHSFLSRGERLVGLCIVVEGAVRIGRIRPDGSFNLIAMLGPGLHFGDVALHRTVSSQHVEAMGRTQIDVIDPSTFETLLDDQPGFAVGLLRANNARFDALLEIYDDARTLTVAVRLAKVIHLHAGRGALKDGVSCRQRDFAQLLGVTEVSIGNALKELEASELVETGYRCVMVPDKTRLGAWLRNLGAAGNLRPSP